MLLIIMKVKTGFNYNHVKKSALAFSKVLD